MIKKYVKLPIPVEAMKFIYSVEGIEALKLFMGNALGSTHKHRNPNAVGEAEICTLEDGKVLKVKHIATENDYIVKGFAEEFWAVKPNIFESTYEEFPNGS